MAEFGRLWYDGNGAIIRIVTSQEEFDRFGVPSGAAGFINFDPETNDAMLQGISTDFNAHVVVGGTLRKNGVPVTINPNGAAYTDRADFAAVRAKLNTGVALTQPDLKLLFRLIFRRLRE